MSLILSGTDGLSDVDGSAATPAIRGTDANTGIFFGADIIGFAEGGAEVARFNADAQFVAAAGTASLPVITTTGDVNTGIFFPAADTIAFSEGGVEAMRIDSAGNVEIGTTSAFGKLNVVQSSDTQIAKFSATSYGLTFNSDAGTGFRIEAADATGVGSYQPLITNGSLQAFRTGNTERMRIDTSGNLLVGTTTSAYGRLEVKINASGAGGAARFINDASSGYTGELVQMISTQGASTAYNILSCYYSGGGAYAFRVRGDGTLFAQNTTVQSASDSRFKENIVNATDGLNVVTALRPVRFDLIEGNGITGKTNQLGFIAQEVQSVFPDAVDVWGESNDPENPYLSLGTTTLIPVLVKAIQEQQALIQSLTTRITALETPVVTPTVTPSTGTQV